MNVFARVVNYFFHPEAGVVLFEQKISLVFLKIALTKQKCNTNSPTQERSVGTIVKFKSKKTDNKYYEFTVKYYICSVHNIMLLKFITVDNFRASFRNKPVFYRYTKLIQQL